MSIPSAEHIREQGSFECAYPVDEMCNPNAGDAEVYMLDGVKYEIITWNERSDSMDVIQVNKVNP
jgi:hypothetical protein